MIKPLTLSVGLAVAFGMSSLAFAGDHGKSLPSPQGPCYDPCTPSAQCAPKDCSWLKKCTVSFHVPKIDWCCIPKPKLNCNYTYTWVLKKQLCGPLITWEKGHKVGHGCDACGPMGVYPTGQFASAQGGAAAYGSGQVFGAGQAHDAAPAPSAEGVEAPPAPAGDMPAPPATSMLFLPRGSN